MGISTTKNEPGEDRYLSQEEAIACAVASIRMEGYRLSDAEIDLIRRRISGEIDHEQFLEMVMRGTA